MPDYSEIFSDPAFAQYADYAPQYDDWQEQFINLEYGFQSQEYGLAGDMYALAGERYGMAQERSLFEQVQRGDARTSAQERLDMQMRGMGQQMGGTLAQSQEQAYDLLSQGEELGTSGLGTRRGSTRRAMKKIEGSSERALESQAMAGLEAKSQYKSTMGDISASAFGSAQQLQQSGLEYDQSGLTYEAAGIAFDRAGMQRERDFAQLSADYEDEMLDYLTMLGQEFGVWWEGDLPEDPSNPLDDPEYDPDDDPEDPGGGDTGDDHNIQNPNSNNFDEGSWGPGNPWYDQNPDLDYWQDPHGDDDDDPLPPPHTGP
tara:strand:- start:16364 stop:17311 length:948 start_codon:yes stop_codon:yes gene_type:complete